MGDKVETCGSGGERCLAEAAMMRAAVLVPTLVLPLRNDTRLGCVDTDEE
jgi:hypothetical protein